MFEKKNKEKGPKRNRTSDPEGSDNSGNRK